jgi:hypothetical protein
MTNRQIIYGSLLCGALTAATMPLVDTHPVVAVASFPFAAVAFAVLMLGAREWRPRRGRS